MPELQRDDVIEVAHGDYAFGEGVLRLQVTVVGPYVRVNAPGQWREVTGVEVGCDGLPQVNALGEQSTRVATVRLDKVRWRNERP